MTKLVWAPMVSVPLHGAILLPRLGRLTVSISQAPVDLGTKTNVISSGIYQCSATMSSPVHEIDHEVIPHSLVTRTALSSQ